MASPVINTGKKESVVSAFSDLPKGVSREVSSYLPA